MCGLTTKLSFFFCLGTVMVLCPVLSIYAGENALKNPGFEESGLFEAFQKWKDNSSWAEVDVHYERKVGRDGTGAAVCVVASNYRRGATQFVQPSIAVRKGQAYIITVWMRGSLTHPVSISLRERGKPYRTFAGHSFRVTNEWRKYSFKAVASDHSVDAYFMVRFQGNGELWLDDAELSEFVDNRQVLPVVEQNLVANGGFEVGVGRWGVLFRESGSPVVASTIEYQNPRPVLDSNHVFEGERAMQVEVPEGGSVRVSSAYFHAIPEKNYTLRIRLRADHPRKVQIGVAHGLFENRHMLATPTTVDVRTNWKTYSLQVRLPQSINDAYFVYVQSSGAGILWLDGIEFAEQLAVEYRSATPVEVGLLRGDIPAIVEVGDTSSLEIVVAAHTGGSATLKLSVFDYEGRQRELLAKTLLLKPGDLWDSDERIPTEQSGYFRVLAEVFVNGERVDTDELAVAIVPAAFLPWKDSPFGNHSRFNDESLELAQRMGVSWLRLHPPRTTKWYAVEPEEGKFKFFDSALINAKNRGMQILGTLDGTPRWASTAPPELTVHNNSGYTAYIPTDYKKWREYVYQTVKHYRGIIDYWEIWNEPSAHTFLKLPYGGGMIARAEAYMKLLRIAYTAAKAANPTAKIVAGCSTTVPPGEWFSLLFERGAYDLMDVASVHLYQDDIPEGPLGISTAESVNQLKAMMHHLDTKNPPKAIWQTEVGVRHTESMYETRVNVELETPLAGDEGAEYIVKRYIDVLESGIEKWFYYNMFWSKRPDRQEYNGLFEWDGSPRPSAVAYAVLAHMLHGQKFEEKVAGYGDQAVVAKFAGDRRKVYVVWSTKTSEKIAIPLAGKDRIVAVYDIMGRHVEHASASVPPELYVGLSPQYVVLESRGDTW